MRNAAFVLPLSEPEPDAAIPLRRPMLAVGGLASAYLAVFAAGAWALATGRHEVVLGAMLCQAPVYAAAAHLALRHGWQLSGLLPLFAVIGTAILARAVLLPLAPVSTDIYRYVWDGRMQSHGINPYRFVPADPSVAEWRDTAIFPNINRIDSATTIYPPVAQMVFWAATRFGETVPVMKAALVAFEGLTVVGLIGLMRRRGLPPARLLLYLWHPLPLWEVAGSGHVDAAATGLMLVAILAADRRRQGLAGVLLALGAGVKYFPAFVAPALYERFGWRMPVAFAATLALAYAPYLGAGMGVLGYLPGYAQEEGLAGGSGVFWLGLLARVAPAGAAAASKPYLVAAGAMLLAGGVAVALRRRPGAASTTAAQGLLLAFILAVTPHYPWYVIGLVPFLCLAPSLSVAYLTLMAPTLYGTIWPFDRFTSEAVIFIPFIALAVIDLRRAAAARQPEELS